MTAYAALHDDPQGPGDKRPTAKQIIDDEGLEGKLLGKRYLITGCSSGIGVETARALHLTGADIVMTVRDMAKGEEVAKDILSGAAGGKGGKVDLLKLELDSLQSVRESAAEFLSKWDTLNVLINNAGVMACPESQTKDGFKTQFGTNHLAHHLLFQLLKPTLLASSTPEFNSRVVSVSSSGHRTSPVLFDDLDLKKRGYDPWVAYGQSKTANIYFANEIERRYGAQGLHATSLMPGGIMTPLARHLDPSVMEKMVTPAMKLWMKNVEQGAATTVWAAVGKEWEGRGGKYLEDCGVAECNSEGGMGKGGYAPHAYDEAAEKQLWELSNSLVGLPKDA